MTHDEMIAVIEAYKRGEPIQSRPSNASPASEWVDDTAPSWNFKRREYRPKPKPFEVWVNVYPSGTFGSAYLSPIDAVKNCGNDGRVVHMREVQE